MKTFLAALKARLNSAALHAYVKLQIFASQEPVRLRAALLSAVMAVGFLVPAAATADVAQSLAAVGTVALPILVGESARKKVTPAE